jgi:hypothetical protein
MLTAYQTATRNPQRRFMQTVMSVTHLYGVLIYYSTSLVDILLKDQYHCRPEARYVWGYFVGGNIPWVIVPACKPAALDCRCLLLTLLYLGILYSCMKESGKASIAGKSKKSQ